MVNEPGIYCGGCGEEDYVCAQYPCDACDCPRAIAEIVEANANLFLPTQPRLGVSPIDFHRFGENVAWFSWMLRLQIIFSLATDASFAEKTAKAYSATARLKAIATTCNAPNLEVN